jgi:hypothetical protein
LLLSCSSSIAAISASSTTVNVNEIGFIALGLAAYAGDQLTDGFRLGGRPLARRGGRRPFCLLSVRSS